MRPALKSAIAKSNSGRSTSSASPAPCSGPTSPRTWRPASSPAGSTARRSPGSSRTPRRRPHSCRHYPFGCKRPIIDDGYFETFNRDNVTLVDLRKGAIEEITRERDPDGPGTSSSRRHRLRHRVRRHDRRPHPDRRRAAAMGRPLRDVWTRDGPGSYLGLQVAGFPNLFIVAGPVAPRAGQRRELASNCRSTGSPTASPTCVRVRTARSNHDRTRSGVGRSHELARRRQRRPSPHLQLMVDRLERPG